MKDYLIFGDIDSRDYNIEVFFNDIDRTPKRVYTQIDVAGRNGAYFLDAGKYEDVHVIYSCIALNDEDRKDFVNALSSKVGYFKMQDSFNSDEFYSAVFDGDVDPNITSERDKSTFDISFTRKPQRWLTSGETAIDVNNGDTLTNPTLFGASPLIRCNGYGWITLKDSTIVVSRVPIGNLLISDTTSVTVTNAALEINPPVEILRTVFDASNLNTGDAITLSGSYVKYDLKYSAWEGDHFTTAVVESDSGEDWDTNAVITSESTLYFNTRIPPISFKKGTSSTKTYYYDGRWVMTSGGSGVEKTFRHYIKVKYDGNNTIKLYTSTNRDDATETYTETGYLGQINGNSTVIRNDDIYIDLDIGEAYFADGTSANYAVQLPAELPTLASGNNLVSFDATFTKMIIVPRWWKI